MRDQAQSLRDLVKNANVSNSQFFENGSKVFTITSGKGGVGKTNITVNLAIALKRLGIKVLIIDADLGLSNVEVLFGTSAESTVKDLLEGKKRIEAIVQEGPFGINFISGGSGIVDLADIDESKLMRLVQSIEVINRHFEIVLIDTGAGISKNVLEFVLMSDEVIVVTTPEPTAITDAYAIIKAVISKGFTNKIHILVNRANSKKEADEIFSRLSGVIKRFLNRDVEYIGYIENNDLVSKSVIKQVPFIISFEKSDVSRQIEEIAKKVVLKQKDNLKDRPTGLAKFISNIIKRFG